MVRRGYEKDARETGPSSEMERRPSSQSHWRTTEVSEGRRLADLGRTAPVLDDPHLFRTSRGKVKFDGIERYGLRVELPATYQ
jgi:hypothetical protein